MPSDIGPAPTPHRPLAENVCGRTQLLPGRARQIGVRLTWSGDTWGAGTAQSYCQRPNCQTSQNFEDELSGALMESFPFTILMESK